MPFDPKGAVPARKAVGLGPSRLILFDRARRLDQFFHRECLVVRPIAKLVPVRGQLRPDHVDVGLNVCWAAACLNLPTADDSLIAKPPRGRVSMRWGCLQGMLHMSSERRIFPRRYEENFRQSHTLIGLTSDETREFERLDRLSPVDHLGNCTWNFEGDPKTPEEKRWLELYRKHEIGWRLWLAAEGDWVVAVPYRPAHRNLNPV
jgi:hypothetical protein